MKPSKRTRQVIEQNVRAQLFLRFKKAGMEDPMTVKISEELEYTVTFDPFDYKITLTLDYDDKSGS